ncbi:glucose-induced degradation protein [Anaeramoeba ignava]|uniref:Glucose-induced degradation protein n=1 Tax=Anaeramoeba ignava TaxID=1746090 RepID=A0A9Q0LJB8_ANAIG|nr:glucose-induced degradation protein [Anaeramoeba ignava]
MSLLAFDNKKESPVGGLLDNAQRQKVANSKLSKLLKTLLYTQKQLEEKVHFPQLTEENLTTGKLVLPEKK